MIDQAKAKAIAAKVTAARELLHGTREQIAAELLAPDHVLAAITAAAARGQGSITIRPERPMRLDGTRAAKELDALLTGPLKVVLRWEIITSTQHGDTAELVIRFG